MRQKWAEILLIELYGIEIALQLRSACIEALLIELYGIEIE